MLSKIAIIDLETGGLLVTDPIVEVAVMLLDTAGGAITELFNACMKEPGRGNAAAIVCSVKDCPFAIEELEQASPLESYRGTLQAAFDEFPVTSWNRKFDIGFLEYRGFAFPHLAPDPMEAAAGITCLPPTPRMAQYYPDKLYKTPRLEEAWQCIIGGAMPGPQHRAGTDARCAALVLWEMICRGDYPLPLP